MIQIPTQLSRQYTAFITQKGVQSRAQQYYLKWLRYYLDFCHRYGFNQHASTSIPSFIEKLKEKRQAGYLQEQARHAVTLFLAMQSDSENVLEGKSKPVDSATENNKGPTSTISGSRKTLSNQGVLTSANAPPAASVKKSLRAKGYRQTGADWTEIFTGLKNSIKIRHYSPKTLKTYTGWTRKFQTYVKSKDPALVSVEDVKAFLTWLAVDQHVSASSQNQAFNALLFLFRNVFGKEFGKIDGVVRAKRKPYIPVVLSRGEVDRIVGLLKHPYKLIISLMYGCGLRISECLSLRVHCFNFDMKILTVHDGKGKKDRTVPIPDALLAALKTQLNRVIEQHERDCQAGYAGVFLFGQLEKKYKNAARELVWQWFFPAKGLTVVPGTNERRRYHVHDSALQKALRTAVKKAQVPKRVTSHTFRTVSPAICCRPIMIFVPSRNCSAIVMSGQP